MDFIFEEREQELSQLVKDLLSGRYIKHYRGCAVSQSFKKLGSKCNCGLEEVMERARALICDLDPDDN